MGRNVEIKAVAGDFDRQRALAEALADTRPEVLLQEDTFYVTREGRLKLRVLSGAVGELIYYHRPDTEGPSTSDYKIFRTEHPSVLKELLESALPVRGAVRKERTLLMCGQTRIHLDQVEGLGGYIELEVVLEPEQTEADGVKTAQGLMDWLEIKPGDLVREAYMDLLERAE